MEIQARAVPFPRTPPLQLDLDHSEQVLRTVSAITIDPFKNSLFYFFPFLQAFSNSYVEIRKNDPAQEAMMPALTKGMILREIRDLTEAAEIKRILIPYASLNHSFLSCGGSFSWTRPAIFMPHQHLFRIGKSPFTQETPQDQLAADPWKYTDDETRYLIARELGHIKQNDQLLRIGLKIALIAIVFFFYASPISFISGCFLLALSIGTHLISEKSCEAKMDVIGVDILTRRLNNRRRAIDTALSTLDKMRRQNLFRRQHSKLCTLYITKSGNNVLDFNHPFLTSRIERLQKMLT